MGLYMTLTTGADKRCDSRRRPYVLRLSRSSAVLLVKRKTIRRAVPRLAQYSGTCHSNCSLAGRIPTPERCIRVDHRGETLTTVWVEFQGLAVRQGWPLDGETITATTMLAMSPRRCNSPSVPRTQRPIRNPAAVGRAVMLADEGDTSFDDWRKQQGQ
jgi:hypothetical protein